MTTIAHPPETLEGWYLSHHVYAADRAALRGRGDSRAALLADADAALRSLAPAESDGGWSASFALAGSSGDLMIIHARPTLDALGQAERQLATAELFDHLRRQYTFLSITEAGLYHITAQLAKEAEVRGGSVGDDAYRAALAERAATERGSPHLQRRLYPPLSADMPYVCFYPMSKRRDPGANWYQLTLEERSRLMYAHGLTGRRYAGRIQQTISGAIGLDDWEWGVTLIARDPLDFKRIVTDMRFDEVSAVYATFGRFFVGKRATIAEAVG
ncbi:MAG: chlorite dismutase family protein [Gemmatimonadaceae bacterium]